MDNSNSTPPEKQAWVTVSSDHPCSKCGKTDWCSINESANRGICRRLECGERKEDQSGGAYWVFPLNQIKLPELSVIAGNTEERHAVYSSLLALLGIADVHRQHLRDRSLTDAQIDKASYRSLPEKGRSSIAKQLVTRHGIDVCFRVPGIVKRTGKYGEDYATIAGFAGILIPARMPMARCSSQLKTG